jgi:para-aminobenzoate synthetase/4-amino-4-deoxychorismate lyase
MPVPGGRARLLTGLERVIAAYRVEEVVPALELLRGAGEVAGFLAYEAGLALEPKLAAAGAGAVGTAPRVVRQIRPQR